MNCKHKDTCPYREIGPAVAPELAGFNLRCKTEIPDSVLDKITARELIEMADAVQFTWEPVFSPDDELSARELVATGALLERVVAECNARMADYNRADLEAIRNIATGDGGE